MILPTLRVNHHAGKVFNQSGLDSIERCIDIQHFKNYPFDIEYRYNSRGFRDHEWPTNLTDAIWCVGDSFTVGIGQPFAHIWPQILGSKIKKRTINFSMDGASNNWISRRSLDLIHMVNPDNLVIMWSYVERRERMDLLHARWTEIYHQIKDPYWPIDVSLQQVRNLPEKIKHEIQQFHKIDLDFFTSCNDDMMIYQDVEASDNDNFDNWCACVDLVAGYDQIIHAVIPQWVEDHETNKRYWEYLDQRVVKKIRPFACLDRARDGHHFDILTAEHFVRQVIELLH